MIDKFKGQKVMVIRGSLKGQEFQIEDSWMNVMGKSWKYCVGNPACLKYAVRSACDKINPDDNVLYSQGTLLHESEIELIHP